MGKEGIKTESIYKNILLERKINIPTLQNSILCI